MKTLYFDCFSGASGNMILGGLVSLGIDRKKLVKEIKKLEVAEFKVKFSNTKRAGIIAIYAETVCPKEKEHRNLADIKKIINKTDLSKSVKKLAIKIFTNLARAEAKVHGIAIKRVHFHEVGALDAIIDIVGACIGFEMLEIDRFVCSKINVGSGFVEMEHGKFPVPPPAVTEILNEVPIYSNEIEGELLTPTGAAIITTVCEEFGEMPAISIEKTAYGAGTREYEDFPNVLRMILGTAIIEEEKPVEEVEIVEEKEFEKVEQLESVDDEIDDVSVETEEDEDSPVKSATLTMIETNLDDVSPEILGFVMEKAFEIGALDCWFTSIQMKKNRPATKLSILCGKDLVKDLSILLFKETTTIGIRLSEIRRESLPRKVVNVKTVFGDVDVKVAEFEGEIVNAKPEYERMREIALGSSLSIKAIEKEVLRNLVESNEE